MKDLTLDAVEAMLRDPKTTRDLLEQLGRERFGATPSQLAGPWTSLIWQLTTFANNERTHNATMRRHVDPTGPKSD